MEVTKVLLMGVPITQRIKWGDQMVNPVGGVTDWLLLTLKRGADNIIYYNNGGSDEAKRKMEKAVNQIVEDLGVRFREQPKVMGTWFTSPNIINYGGKAASLYPFEVDVVLVMTNLQYHRQLKSNPNKMKWADWFTQRKIPVLVAKPNGMWDNELSRP